MNLNKRDLDIFVNIMETSHVRSPVTDYQVSTAALKLRHDLVGGGELGDIALQLDDTRQGGHGLQVNGNYLDIFPLNLWSLK